MAEPAPDSQLAHYLDAAAAVQGLALDANQRAAALLQLNRLAQIAAAFVDTPLAVSEEPILGLVTPADAL